MLASGGENAAFSNCGVHSKKFELISPKICRAGGIPPNPPPARRSDPFGPACQQAGWTISIFSNSPVANCSALPSLAVNSFLIYFQYTFYFPIQFLYLLADDLKLLNL